MTEREAFEEMMVTHAARLCEWAGHYVTRLVARDREYLLSEALEIAWRRCDGLRPEKIQLIVWWDECLRSAAMRRKVWRIHDGNGYRWVPGKRLGW
jgi:hypothetical protein